MVSRRESDGEDSIEVDPESADEDAIKYGRAFLSVRHRRATTYDSSFFDGRYIWKPSVLFHRWAIEDPRVGGLAPGSVGCLCLCYRYGGQLGSHGP